MTLFRSAPDTTPAGLLYIPDFIDASSEKTLLEMIDAAPWITELKRRVQHYGYRYDYKARTATHASKIGDIPSLLAGYCDGLLAENYFATLPDQAIVNEYLPGQGIAAHIDCVPCFGETIASISLLSPCVMDFIHNKTREKYSLLLEPRSLLLLSGEARYEWRHGISARKTDKHYNQIIPRDRRISLTFRTMLLPSGS